MICRIYTQSVTLCSLLMPDRLARSVAASAFSVLETAAMTIVVAFRCSTDWGRTGSLTGISCDRG